MRKIIKIISSNPITGNDLLELWPGVAPCTLAGMIDAKNADYTDIEPEKKILDFPRAYVLVADLLRDPETQKIHAHCMSCMPDYKKGEKYTRPYRRLPKGQYDFSELIFRSIEVKAYGELHPEVFWERVNPEDTPLARNSKQKKDIRRLRKEIDELNSENAELKAKLADLKDPSKNISTPNSEQQIEKWKMILPEIKKESLLIAAKLAIEKWKGKSHKEAFAIVRPDSDILSKEQFVARKKKDVQTLIDTYKEYGLAMPPWQSH